MRAEASDSPSSVSASVRLAETVASTASPIAPPTCADVLTRPEARPASSGVALDIASFMSAGNELPAPNPSRSICGSRSVT